MKIVFRLQTEFQTSECTVNQFEDLILGRSSKAGRIVDDPKISSFHCRISLKENILEVIDMKSKNGTYINGIRIEMAQVFLGDQIKIGDSILTLEKDKCDPESLEILTFPGILNKNPNKESLKKDFSGTRAKNQQVVVKMPVLAVADVPVRSHEQEVVLRRVAESVIHLSPEEIKANHNWRTFFGKVIDFLILLFLLYIPVHFFGISEQTEVIQKLAFTEGLIFTLYLFLNAKLLKFTLGQTILGLRRKYNHQ